MNLIEIRIINENYCATYTGAHAQEIIDLFGTATLPTPFMSGVPISKVVSQLALLNPCAKIIW